MPRCPNCSYILVALKDSQRCKCAKCGGLFSRKAAEGREFRTWNGKQREIDAEALASEIKRKQEEMLNKRMEKQKQLSEMRNRPKMTEEERKQKNKERDQRYYNQHREEKLLQKKLWMQANKEHCNTWKRKHRINQAEKIRQQDRIEYWRKQQKILISLLFDDTIINN